jgi:uncharacterized protein (TIGR02757 family)
MNQSLLKEKLNALCETYDREFLQSDPVSFVHQYPDSLDKEVVGLVCAVLAYGNVKMIQRNLERLLAPLGRRPSEYVRRFNPAREESAFAGFSHRFTKGKDILLLLYYMKQILETAGSVGGFFRDGCGASEPDIELPLTNFVERVLALDCSPLYPGGVLPDDAGVRFLFPSPANGSACKRLNLYLRWMVRRADGIDFGLWQFISPSQLIVPLDTHMARICSLIGLTRRKAHGWAMAAEITDNLRKLDPLDPIRYDFAISRLGILARCPKNPVADTCRRCEIRGLCIKGEKGAHASHIEIGRRGRQTN